MGSLLIYVSFINWKAAVEGGMGFEVRVENFFYIA